MKEPLVSIIVPVYNGERSIERCLRSIQNQTYRNIEVIVAQTIRIVSSVNMQSRIPDFVILKRKTAVFLIAGTLP